MPRPNATGNHGNSRPGPVSAMIQLRTRSAKARTKSRTLSGHVLFPSRPTPRSPETRTLRGRRPRVLPSGFAADLFGEGITQTDRAVEHQAIRFGVGIAGEIAL